MSSNSVADELRQAAQRIREVADRATPGPWALGNDTVVARKVEQLSAGTFTCLQAVADTSTADRENWSDDDPEYVAVEPEDDAEHIALWDPPTALLVADLLADAAAGLAKPSGRPLNAEQNASAETYYRFELAIARAINGSE